MPIFPIVALLIIGLVLFLSGIWIIFFSNSVRSTSDLSRVLIFGFVGAAALRLFFKPRENIWIGWQKNLLGSIFIVVGIVILYFVIKFMLEFN